MSNVLKKGFVLGACGFAMGVFIGICMCAVSGGVEFTPINVFYLLVGGLYGAWAMGGSAVYDIEEWSILRCTLTHFISTLLAFYLMGTIQGGWLVIGSTVFWIVTAAFVVCYFIIWLVQYLKYKREVRIMNEELKEFKKKSDP